MLYAGSGSPIPNDTMEQFKASDQDWKGILRAAETSFNFQSRTILELRDRVAALEAERTPEAAPAAAPAAAESEATPPVDSAVEQNDRKWITDRMPVASEANFYSNVEVPASSRSSEPITSSGRRFTKFYMINQGEPWLPASIEYYKDRQALVAKGYQQGLAAGRAEQQAMAKLPTDSDYDAPQSLHSVALDMVDSLGRSFNLLPEILDTLRRAIREPMAEQQATCKAGLQVADDLTPEPTPEPIPSPAAGDAGLVEVVVRAMRAAPLGYQPEARAAILAVARWLRSMGNFSAATNLEREANQ